MLRTTRATQGFLLHTLILLLMSARFLSAETPNIVFILSDDQGYGDLSSFGSTVIETPNIDSLGETGMKFTSFYVHNRCTPTRAAFMTGCHAQRVDMGKVIYHRDKSGINSNEITVAELLQSAGYRTAIIGKWHLGEYPQFNPLNHGFDYFLGRIADETGKNALFENFQKIGPWETDDDRFRTMRLVPAAREFIRKHKDEPFFLYYASNIPHSKWEPHANFKGTSKQGLYGDSVQQLDWAVGEILSELETQGLSDKTLVIFASDNGPQLNADGYGSAAPLRDGKWSDFEGGIRVPCLMRWPGTIKAGSANHDIVGIIDMLPTFCEIIGKELPSDRIIDGKSILPYFRGERLDKPIHDRFIVPNSTIRIGDWKLLMNDEVPGGGLRKGKTNREAAKAGSLFNLKTDIGETTDLSDTHPEIASKLAAEMERFMEEFRTQIRPREQLASPVN